MPEEFEKEMGFNKAEEMESQFGEVSIADAMEVELKKDIVLSPAKLEASPEVFRAVKVLAETSEGDLRAWVNSKIKINKNNLADHDVLLKQGRGRINLCRRALKRELLIAPIN